MGQKLVSTPPDQGLENYEMLGLIGCGDFSEVKLAQHLLTRTPVVVKITRKTGSCITTSQREMNILKRVSLDNGVHIRGNLCQWMYRNLVTEEEARAMFQQMLSAMQYCHRKRIVHRDLNPGNSLLDSKDDVQGSALLLVEYYDPQTKN
ncbi:hypothetical protein P7K49_030736 [Saguinus oedipus]|uniref:non-specific serine/threonine protein kinase n=1 Tax=Saguinus oedipus TaxID=9490 RepID=A0ABQ9U300_SAGOE|nr:hypothetical protein P7K49_030736 [Saguinus oedipus]